MQLGDSGRVPHLTSLLLGRVVFRGGQIHSLGTGFYVTSRAQGVLFCAESVPFDLNSQSKTIDLSVIIFGVVLTQDGSRVPLEPLGRLRGGFGKALGGFGEPLGRLWEALGREREQERKTTQTKRNPSIYKKNQTPDQPL